MMLLEKKLTILVLLLMLSVKVLAVEGMWLPSLIGKNIDEMQQMGLQLSAEDLYSEDAASLKDAIVRFGRGCTGAFLSEKGLLLTNHHCGYGQIQAHSSVENDYLTHGFWASTAEEELANPGLTITLLVRMENVTANVLEVLNANMTEEERNEAVKNISRIIVEEAREEGKYEASVDPFYYGNEYYLFVYNIYRDVRLVGAPPSSIGKFGGDEDNWMWPRHSGDFMLFRVYADENNQPADYNENNVPYQPAHYFPVSNAGLQEDDFTMVYGFPGRTTRYLTSDAVEFIMERENPMGIDVRTRILQIYEQEMAQSDAVRIQYATKHARVSNAWKKWQGENRGLKRLDAVNVKKQLENDFVLWANTTPGGETYLGLMEAFESTYNEYHPYRFALRLYAEAGRSIEITRFAGQFSRLVALSSQRDTDPEEIEAEIERLKSAAESFFRDYHKPVDRMIMAEMSHYYIELSEDGFLPDVFMDARRKFNGDMERFANDVFNKTLFASRQSVMEFLEKYRVRDHRKILRDPAFAFAESLDNYFRNELQPRNQELQNTLDSLYRFYNAGLRAMKPDYNFFPDANGTLRISYGKVEGSYPRDAVKFIPFSTAEGILEKAGQKDIEDYRIPARLDNLLQQQDYGTFANDGNLVVNFISSNHTTGGNSGSPVIDARGNLIGLNFDRSWESTMSDIMFDPEQCRNISVNSQYMLWVIEHYAQMGYLLEEMDVVN